MASRPSETEKLLDFSAILVNLHGRQDSEVFAACWNLIGQIKFQARQPYVRRGGKKVGQGPRSYSKLHLF